MSNYEEIASRIADVIISPDSVLGLVHGVISIPIDLGYLAYGYIDSQSRYPHQTERIRIAQAIKNGILNHDRIIESIKIVFEKFDKYVSESKQNQIYSKTTFSLLGRATGNSIISSKVATAICGRASLFVSLRGGLMGNILLAGGMTERSIRTSEHQKNLAQMSLKCIRHSELRIMTCFILCLNPLLNLSLMHLR